MKSPDLSGKYQSKLRTADEAVRMIGSGQRVFIGSSCGEPQHLINALMDNADRYLDVEIVRLLSLESSLLALMADEYRGRRFHVRSIYQGSDYTKGLRANRRFITPITLSAVPGLFKKGLLPLHFSLIQVSSPDDNGWMSLGISVDVTLAAAQTAATVIAQINPRMPRIQGHSFIHLNMVTFRPAKPVDDRLIQEHFYRMDQKDVQARFFGTRRSFFREDMEDLAQVDYINNLSVVAVTGEFGFEEIIGLGEYALAQGAVAEVAFSVSTEWQGKGIASVILEKITQAAREKGFTDLVAYTRSTNIGMIKLFKKLPYKTETIIENDTVVLKCSFENK